MQQVLSGAAPSGLRELAAFEPQICFKHVWIPETAHFRSCFLPVIAGIPAVLAAAILVVQIVRLLAPWRAKWMRPFVEEIVEPAVEVELVPCTTWPSQLYD